MEIRNCYEMIPALVVLLGVLYLWAGIGFFITFRSSFREGLKGLHRQLLIILIWPFIVSVMATEASPALLGWFSGMAPLSLTAP